MEIERKFVPLSVPEDLENYSSIHMKQGYLCTSPVVRVRRENDEYVLTYKGAGLMAHTEYNLPLDAASFETLIQKCDGRIIEKTRYLLPVEGYPALYAELDIFEGELDSLVILEVEFPDLETANAFVPPVWYGTEVTEDPRFHNNVLSQGGEIPELETDGKAFTNEAAFEV